MAIAKDPESYGFKTHESSNGKTQDILVKKASELKKLAHKYKTKLSVLRTFNPDLLTDATPPYQYSVKVPA